MTQHKEMIDEARMLLSTKRKHPKHDTRYEKGLLAFNLSMRKDC